VGAREWGIVTQTTARQRNPRPPAAVIGAAFIVATLSAAGAAPLYEEPRHLSVQPSISQSDARSRCAPTLAMPDRACSVGEFGRIGTVAGHEYFYAHYDYRDVPPTPPDIPYPRIVIFEGEPSAMLRPILISGEDPAIHYEPPVILHAGGRLVLHIPASESGSAQLNHEIMYVWAQDGWRDVDVTSWLGDLDHRLAKGLGVQKGIYPDYAKMTASTPLWRNNEAPCPTGGRASMDLQWRGDRIALRGLRIEKHDWGC
jgi:hypothetical protein